MGVVCVRSWINFSGFGGFADGRRNEIASPDSENIEQVWTEGSIAKLFERGANPRGLPPSPVTFYV